MFFFSIWLSLFSYFYEIYLIETTQICL